MSDVIAMKAQLRDRAGKGAARATRREGLVPGVIYGNKQAPTLIAMDPRLLRAQMARGGFYAHMYDIDLGDAGTERVMARDIQLHPVTDQPQHVDFLRVSADTVITMEIPVIFVNDTASPGLKRGGVLNVVRHAIEVRCTPAAAPESIQIDLTGADIGDSIHISSVKLPEGVKPTITDRDFTVATIAAPTVAPAAAGEEEQA
ncbi:50S ribosomal protein L25/general stress protein Ctc [Telmatospirillum sp. J64-1]|uniref:50S ribosomal protein L25/general stress protein Ctc n=1 Tax=Telmatospirillum sp. J64-1 TaxID=2502183 RepID=UPI00115EFCF7|nr:50S ribosomal protein L25/general stress protein Ctc [Telmatospirillum sp. J64-1]